MTIDRKNTHAVVRSVGGLTTEQWDRLPLYVQDAFDRIVAEWAQESRQRIEQLHHLRREYKRVNEKGRMRG